MFPVIVAGLVRTSGKQTKSTLQKLVQCILKWTTIRRTFENVLYKKNSVVSPREMTMELERDLGIVAVTTQGQNFWIIVLLLLLLSSAKRYTVFKIKNVWILKVRIEITNNIFTLKYNIPRKDSAYYGWTILELRNEIEQVTSSNLALDLGFQNTSITFKRNLHVNSR